MNKSQFANFANNIQLSDLKLPVMNSELKKCLKKVSNCRRETVKEKLAGWNDGPKQVQPRRSVLASVEKSPIKIRSKDHEPSLSKNFIKLVGKNEFKNNRAELNLSPLRIAASRKPKKSFDLTKDIPSFIIHETELDLK